MPAAYIWKVLAWETWLDNPELTYFQHCSFISKKGIVQQCYTMHACKNVKKSS